MVSIKDVGGEFALIERITKKCNSSDVIVGVGDDCAVVDLGVSGKYHLLTTDMFIEGNHFSLEWCSFFDIGWKVIQVSVSDVCAMGGSPLHVTVAGSFPVDLSVEKIEDFSKGMYAAAAFLSVEIVGGDTTRGKMCCFCVSVVGVVDKKDVCLRSHARVGDLIVVSGDVGRSGAGLALLLAGLDGEDVEYYKKPVCVGDFGSEIAPFVHAMIDVSDGVASEVLHICKQSNVGAIVFKEKLPISTSTVSAGSLLDVDPGSWALSGGEDFVLLFTVSPDVFASQKELFKDCTVIGKVLDDTEGVFLDVDGVKKDLGKGFDHFG